MVRTIMAALAMAVAAALAGPALAQTAQPQVPNLLAPLEQMARQANGAILGHAGHARHGGHAAHAAHREARRELVVPNRFRHPRVDKVARRRHPSLTQLQWAERDGFKKVSDLVAFPPFFPGLGIVTVKPETLTMGPFRCFDRRGRLVATVYMPSLKDMDEHHTWENVKGLPAPVDHATMYYHPGHAGVQFPHYHVVLWHVRDESVVAK